jgi:hypothetical protein
MIHYASSPFDFNEVSLSKPTAMQGGSFFSKILKKNDPLYIYSPKCQTQGMMTTGAKHVDFRFTKDESFVNWIESLEERIQALIYEHRTTWFVTDSIDLDDIQHSFMPMLKFKGSNYTVRGHLPTQKHPWKDTLQVYNEDESPVPIETVNGSTVVSILDIHGIKFNDKSFQVMIYVRQIMVLSQSLFSECKIKIKEEFAPVDISESIVIPYLREVPNSK